MTRRRRLALALIMGGDGKFVPYRDKKTILALHATTVKPTGPLAGRLRSKEIQACAPRIRPKQKQWVQGSTRTRSLGGPTWPRCVGYWAKRSSGPRGWLTGLHAPYHVLQTIRHPASSIYLIPLLLIVPPILSSITLFKHFFFFSCRLYTLRHTHSTRQSLISSS